MNGDRRDTWEDCVLDLGPKKAGSLFGAPVKRKQIGDLQSEFSFAAGDDLWTVAGSPVTGGTFLVTVTADGEDADVEVRREDGSGKPAPSRIEHGAQLRHIPEKAGWIVLPVGEQTFKVPVVKGSIGSDGSKGG